MTQAKQGLPSLHELYHAHQGKVSDKWSSYLNQYDSQLARYRDKKINILEIGIQNGGSLEIWSNFFPNAVHIIGCDIDEKCHALNFENERISVVVGDAVDDKVVQHISEKYGAFDIIIDDGSHHSRDIVNAFKCYFTLLRDGGIFVAEDLHCSYWRGYGGGLRSRGSAMEFFKKLIDIANYAHWEIKIDLRRYLGLDPEEHPRLTNDQLSAVDSVFFRDSICSVTKLEKPAREKLGVRLISGQTAIVTGSPHQYDGTYCEPGHAKKKIVSLLTRLRLKLLG